MHVVVSFFVCLFSSVGLFSVCVCVCVLFVCVWESSRYTWLTWDYITIWSRPPHACNWCWLEYQLPLNLPTPDVEFARWEGIVTKLTWQSHYTYADSLTRSRRSRTRTSSVCNNEEKISADDFAIAGCRVSLCTSTRDRITLLAHGYPSQRGNVSTSIYTRRNTIQHYWGNSHSTTKQHHCNHRTAHRSRLWRDGMEASCLH